MSNITIQSKAGKGRDPWLIKRELAAISLEIDGVLHNGLYLKDIAKLAKTQANVVSETVKGIRNHKRTLEQLEKVGVPLSLLYPTQYQESKAA